MRSPIRTGFVVCLLSAALAASAFASAYNARPKLVVVIVIDQFRGDYLERYRDQFGEGGFRLFLDHGAYFTECNYDYANTHTAPGHALHWDLFQRARHHRQRVVGPAEETHGHGSAG
jgi:Type I phosphodiesterase / nucleotide pyrophosphatase